MPLHCRRPASLTSLYSKASNAKQLDGFLAPIVLQKCSVKPFHPTDVTLPRTSSDSSICWNGSVAINWRDYITIQDVGLHTCTINTNVQTFLTEKCECGFWTRAIQLANICIGFFKCDIFEIQEEACTPLPGVFLIEVQWKRVLDMANFMRMFKLQKWINWTW